jgi:hypothetical protein
MISLHVSIKLTLTCTFPAHYQVSARGETYVTYNNFKENVLVHGEGDDVMSCMNMCNFWN